MTIHDKAFKRVLDVYDPDILTSIVQGKIRKIYEDIGFSGTFLNYKVRSMYAKAAYNYRKIGMLADRRAHDKDTLKRLEGEHNPVAVKVTKLHYRRAKDAVELKRTRDLFRNR